MAWAHMGGWDVRKREIQTVLISAEGATNTTIDGKYVSVRTHPVTGAEEVVGLASGHAGIVGDTYKMFQKSRSPTT